MNYGDGMGERRTRRNADFLKIEFLPVAARLTVPVSLAETLWEKEKRGMA